ncbi:MAG: hypothetical protein FWF03_01080 [Defluviitaleaceae bacterium]|nr:hypothetical protein [Defluviitaleaceae bacterium]
MLRPIDLTITIQHASEANRAQNQDNARPEVAQHQFAEKLNKEVQHNDQHVTQTNKAEENRVERDGKGPGGKKGGGKKRREAEKKAAKPLVMNQRGGSMLDISI